ncbi:MAG: hypothetical protein R3248_04565 [Candidatus Promineifilaceae bacterium]|nr:hypothetical protein [Candidatus Promineifilaceae bacterium]
MVTIGNLIGSALLVGLVYWFIYLRPGWTGTPVEREEAPARPATRVGSLL